MNCPNIDVTELMILDIKENTVWDIFVNYFNIIFRICLHKHMIKRRYYVSADLIKQGQFNNHILKFIIAIGTSENWFLKHYFALICLICKLARIYFKNPTYNLLVLHIHELQNYTLYFKSIDQWCNFHFKSNTAMKYILLGQIAMAKKSHGQLDNR